jgi:ABC-type branched-subunit amino acid transport system ATPase component
MTALEEPSVTSDLGLAAVGIGVRIGGLQILDEVSLAVNPGEVVGLIGPNGAGKTTMLNVLSGFQRPTAGRVVLAGTSMRKATPRNFARAGVSRTFQAARLFPRLTVRENVEAAAVGTGLRRSAASSRVDDLLGSSNLAARQDVLAESLSYGEERWLGVLRALAAGPRVLLLDEPAAGLNDVETAELGEEIRLLPGRIGCGVLLVEHNMSMVMSLCTRIHVLNYGRTIASGTPAEVRAHPEVIQAYLGTGSRSADA